MKITFRTGKVMDFQPLNVLLDCDARCEQGRDRDQRP